MGWVKYDERMATMLISALKRGICDVEDVKARARNDESVLRNGGHDQGADCWEKTSDAKHAPY